MAGEPGHPVKTVVRVVGALLIAFVAAGPFVLGQFEAGLLAEIMVWGILAMGLDLIFGYTGMLSFGQALFFGLGAYGMALSFLWFKWSFFPALLVAIILAGIAAAVTGFFAVRLTWHYFAIITIIFSLVGYFFAVGHSEITGGDDGLSFDVPPLFSVGGVQVTVYEPIVEYYFILLVTLAAYLLLRQITRSQLGLVFRAVRDNAERASLLGYDVLRYRWISFVIAGLFCGLSGALFAMKSRYASASFLFWTVSGDAVIWTVVGGAGTLVGPLIGTGLLIWVRDYLSTWFEHYLLIIGGIAIVIVLIAPQGIAGVVRDKVLRP
jgi:branched-chain amino acid transport system permease protein